MKRSVDLFFRVNRSFLLILSIASLVTIFHTVFVAADDVFKNVNAQVLSTKNSSEIIHDLRNLNDKDIAEILSKIDMFVLVELYHDPNYESSSGMVYKPKQTGNLFVNLSGGLNENDTIIHLSVDSYENFITVSDDAIGVELTFKIPVSLNSTLESINRIQSSFLLDYIDNKQTKVLIANGGLPIIINDVEYTPIRIEFYQDNNGTGQLFIFGVLSDKYLIPQSDDFELPPLPPFLVNSPQFESSGKTITEKFELPPIP